MSIREFLNVINKVETKIVLDLRVGPNWNHVEFSPENIRTITSTWGEYTIIESIVNKNCLYIKAF